MKKILLSFVLMISIGQLNAQVCVPGTLTAPENAYIIPSVATNFVDACPGQNYEQILYIKAAKDTAITATTPLGTATITADIDSFVVDANIGAPSYYTLESVPAALLPAGPSFPKSDYKRVVIKGDSLACAKISGMTPVGTAPGTTNLTVNLRVYLSNMHCPTNAVVEAALPTLYPGRKTDTITGITGYRIITYAAPCFPVSVNNVVAHSFTFEGFAPNPANTNTTIKYILNTAANCTFKLMNTLGETIYLKSLQGNIGMNQFNFETAHLPAGIYVCSLSNGNKTITKRIEIQH